MSEAAVAPGSRVPSRPSAHPDGCAGVRRLAQARIPTAHGELRCVAYAAAGGVEHLAFVAGEVSGAADALVRLHSECATGDLMGSLRCDCGAQLDEALRRVATEGTGAVVYLRGHEGRGIGIAAKLRAYQLQDTGLDTVDANVALGLPVDGRDYGAGAAILHDLGITGVRLLTNNPDKVAALARHGVRVADRVPLLAPTHGESLRYLRTKRSRMGHLLDGLDSPAAAGTPTGPGSSDQPATMTTASAPATAPAEERP
ncbi:GTP cyclohydrolase II [Streptomyces benahoarensis]|uniref:GTP cyclohydrolase-2 n=1 Tax=Streptomyces benahoarensis TaxID=2595054 RepID=A0A553Z6E2_9ACTN|nr:GTP cyclohydrolase II [Streptomyces benahoarensis]TSB37011.1 GTP cyclohydrolase II [Streptomyces benahoarensis]